MYQKIMEARLQFWGGVILRVALIGMAVYVLWRVRAIVSVVLVSMIVAAAIKAMVDPLCRIQIPSVKPHTRRFVATSLVFLGVGAAMVLAVQGMIAPIQFEFHRLVENWDTYQKQIQEQILRAQAAYSTWPPEVRTFLDNQRETLSIPSPAAYLSDAGKKTLSWASHVFEMALVPILAFYFVLDGRSLRNQLLAFVPRRRWRQTLAILGESTSIMRAYLISQFWLALIAGVIVAVALRLIGMEYALILGVFAGIARFIPVIGPFVGGIPLVVLTFVHGTQTNNPYLWVWAAIAFGTMHVIESKLVMPQFLGHALNLHAVTIIVALLIGGEFFGFIGMFLAAPVAALARVLLMHLWILPQRRKQTAPAPRRSENGTGKVLRLERAFRMTQTVPRAQDVPAPLPATRTVTQD